ncbi:MULTISPECIES: hypothetical protein [unclassified Bartonella]|uniref:hypothetical protein n=1 Tax=unclassified Bartonella TaxID=2645622 RepID=UPI0035CF366E
MLEKKKARLEREKRLGGHYGKFTHKTFTEQFAEGFNELRDHLSSGEDYGNDQSGASIDAESWEYIDETGGGANLRCLNHLQALLSVKASVNQIEQTSFLLSSMRVPANTDAKAVVLSYGMMLNRISSYAMKKGVENIVTGQAIGISKTFMPTCGELLTYYQTVENTLLSKAESVRKAVLNTREKRLKEKVMRENSKPLTLVEKQKLEEI